MGRPSLLFPVRMLPRSRSLQGPVRGKQSPAAPGSGRTAEPPGDGESTKDMGTPRPWLLRSLHPLTAAVRWHQGALRHSRLGMSALCCCIEHRALQPPALSPPTNPSSRRGLGKCDLGPTVCCSSSPPSSALPFPRESQQSSAVVLQFHKNIHKYISISVTESKAAQAPIKHTVASPPSTPRTGCIKHIKGARETKAAGEAGVQCQEDPRWGTGSCWGSLQHGQPQNLCLLRRQPLVRCWLPTGRATRGSESTTPSMASKETPGFAGETWKGRC